MAVTRRQQIRYRVFFTPRSSSTAYGSEIDVSDKIDATGVKNIRKSIDAGDYQIGVYNTDDIVLKGLNINGIFNDENDSRSIFPAGRDLAKVRVVFTQLDDDGDETQTVSFRGLINEEATRADIKTDMIKFRVLSNDSVIRNTKVAAGLISSGSTFSTAMFNILNQTRITDILTVTEVNINPNLDLTIDDGSKFDDRKSREALDDLLLASNSVLLIDDSDNVIIQSRDEDTDNDVLNLFGKSDIFGRENIVDITKYNTGKHRMFTSVQVNTTEASNSAFEEEFGSRRKEFDLDFITTDTKEQQIAERLVDEFKTPKLEVNVSVASSVAKDINLLDRVSLNYPLRLALADGAEFLPVVGITKVNDSDEPLPRQFGSLAILPRVGFKLIEKEENVANFRTTLKLRQFGKDLGDGYFDEPGNCLVGAAEIDSCVLTSGDECATWNPSVLGAAKVDCTEVST